MLKNPKYCKLKNNIFKIQNPILIHDVPSRQTACNSCFRVDCVIAGVKNYCVASLGKKSTSQTKSSVGKNGVVARCQQSKVLIRAVVDARP
jgi:hypothetical protein